jgi:hypothetical protein
MLCPRCCGWLHPTQSDLNGGLTVKETIVAVHCSPYRRVARKKVPFLSSHSLLKEISNTTMNQTTDSTDLLKPIRKTKFSSRQKALFSEEYWEEVELFKLYGLRREPSPLDVFDWKKYFEEYDWETYKNVAIWRENETIILCTDETGDFCIVGKKISRYETIIKRCFS